MLPAMTGGLLAHPPAMFRMSQSTYDILSVCTHRIAAMPL
jgi:hypothetical protein